MDYDVSISIGTTANLGGLRKAQQAVDGLAQGCRQGSRQLVVRGSRWCIGPACLYGHCFLQWRHVLAAGRRVGTNRVH